MEYKGKNILVLGAGRSGLGAAYVLAREGAQVVLNDYKQVALPKEEESRLAKVGVTIITGSQENSLLTAVDRIIVSPGISLYIPILEEARKRGIEIVGEVEIAYDLGKAPILGVTGTNGKTTTTMLLGEVMRAAGYHTCVGGNIGDALSEQALTVPAQGMIIAELSSYQLEGIKNFRTHGAIMLNITPDHLQRHKTMAAYRQAKENIFKNQGAEDFTVLNKDDETVASMVARVPGQVLWFSRLTPVQNGAYLQDGICYAVRGGKVVPILRADEIPLLGAHNQENVLAVIALAYALDVAPSLLATVIKKFSGVEHRIEPVAEINGARYYNDSKATNTDSAIKALEAFDKPVILLAGGFDKGTPLEEFMAVVKVRAKALLLLGNAAERFQKAAEAAGVEPIYRLASMEDAVRQAAALAKEGDVVLLSPACSSFDRYSCFEERGQDFKTQVMKLQESEG